MVPLNRWILAELPGTKMIGLIGGFFRPFLGIERACCAKKTILQRNE